MNVFHQPLSHRKRFKFIRKLLGVRLYKFAIKPKIGEYDYDNYIPSHSSNFNSKYCITDSSMHSYNRLMTTFIHERHLTAVKITTRAVLRLVWPSILLQSARVA